MWSGPRIGSFGEPGKLSVWDEGLAKQEELLEVPLVYLLRGAVAFCQGDHALAMKFLHRAAQAPSPEVHLILI